MVTGILVMEDNREGFLDYREVHDPFHLIVCSLSVFVVYFLNALKILEQEMKNGS